VDFPYHAGDSALAQRIAEANRVIANSVYGLVSPAKQHDHGTTALCFDYRLWSRRAFP
jgi:hypothetical protein